MILFLIFALTISLVVLAILFYSDNVTSSNLWSSYFRGAAVGLIASIALVIYYSSVFFSYSYSNIYFTNFYFMNFIPLTIAQIGYLLFDIILPYKPFKKKDIQYIAYLAGFFSIVNIAISLIKTGWLDSNILFLLPLQNIATCLIITFVSLKILSIQHSIRYPFFFTTILISFITAFVSYFFYINLFFWSFLILILLLAGGIVLLLLFRERV